MKQILFLLIFSTLFIEARYEAVPAKSCSAYNNMKHTQNSHNVHLDTQREYTMLQQHKGQILVLVKGENPAQRWVDESCFPSKTSSYNTYNNNTIKSEHTKKYQNSAKPKYSLLALSWQNAFCETHRSRKECRQPLFSFGQKRYSESHFVLHGLWPQPQSNSYCNVDAGLVTLDRHGQWNRLPEPELDSELKEKLSKVMPGVSSNLQRHEWVKHGSCYGTDAQSYFKDAIILTEQVNGSKVSRFFVNNAGKRVTLKQVRFLFDNTFGKGSGKRVELRCQNGLITELWLHMGNKGEDLSTMLKSGKPTRSRCQSGIIDKAGYGY
ncbi:ribonuclease T2 family protein [Sulfurovum lithotrophicum]|nr:hypothetical protein [Sulfurovum lithotrophicum]